MQELKLLREMLESGDYAFVLDLAVLANRREFLNLQTWLPGVLQCYFFFLFVCCKVLDRQAWLLGALQCCCCSAFACC